MKLLLLPFTRYRESKLKDYRKVTKEEQKHFGSHLIAVFKKKSVKRRAGMKGNIFFAGIITLNLFLFASSKAMAARPLTTDDAGTVDLGSFEIELGYEFSQSKDNAQIQSIGISLKHGLSERFDFGISFPYELKPKSGLGGAEVGIKFSLLKEKNLPATSLTFTFGLGGSEYTLNGIMSKELFGTLSAHLNLGYVAPGIVTESGITTYSGAIEFPTGKNLTMVTELVGESNAEGNSWEGLIGGNLQVLRGMVLDFAIGKGFNGTSIEWKTGIGLTYGF